MMMLKWNYWDDWSWKRELDNSQWAEKIKRTGAVNGTVVPKPLEEPRHLTLVQTEEQYATLLDKLKNARIIGFDSEASGRDCFAGDYSIAGLCFAVNVDEGWYIPIHHKTADCKFGKLFRRYEAPFKLFDEARVVKDLHRIEFHKKALVVTSGNYELHTRRHMAKQAEFFEYIGHVGPVYDTLFYYRVQNPMVENGLKERTSSEFGYDPPEFKEQLEKKGQKFTETDPRITYAYASTDPVGSLRHAYYQMNEAWDANIYNVCNIVEWPLVPKLVDIEAFGNRLDTNKLKTAADLVRPHVSELAKQCRRFVGRDINVNNPTEKYNLLYNELRCPTPDGRPPDRQGGTDGDKLKELGKYVPIVQKELKAVLKGMIDEAGRPDKAWDPLLRAAAGALSKSNAAFKPFVGQAIDKNQIISIMKMLSEASGRMDQLTKVLEILHQYSTLSKLHSAFLESLPYKLSAQDNHLHTRFNQIVRSGRQSGTDPNLMQLPRDAKYSIKYHDVAPLIMELLRNGCTFDDKGRIVLKIDVRESILPPEGFVFVTADYDAMEMRMLAAISRCPVLWDVINGKDADGKEYDPHVKAVELMNLLPGWKYMDLKKAMETDAKGNPLDEAKFKLVKGKRQLVKPINFGLVYGITEFGLAAQLEVSVEEAKRLMENYFQVYYGVAKWLKETHSQAAANRGARTKLGRWRGIPPEAYEDEHALGHFVRACGNHLIQGNCADIAKFAERQFCDAIREPVIVTRRSKQFCNFVHDEFIAACRNDPKEVQYTAAALQLTMQKKVGGILFTATPEVKMNLSKDAKNLMSEYPAYDDPSVALDIASSLRLDPKDLQSVPWWSAEVETSVSTPISAAA
jgi:DNA polymerase I-like protein with 3'-5' exonuclease and polymerase domains